MVNYVVGRYKDGVRDIASGILASGCGNGAYKDGILLDTYVWGARFDGVGQFERGTTTSVYGGQGVTNF